MHVADLPPPLHKPVERLRYLPDPRVPALRAVRVLRHRYCGDGPNFQTNISKSGPHQCHQVAARQGDRTNV
eukprot:scaffold157099_cov32-Tisochrysis_lutea.AAC.1